MENRRRPRLKPSSPVGLTVTIRRTGGVAGIPREITIPVHRLAAGLRRAVLAALAKPPARDAAKKLTRGTHPDGFAYHVIARTPLGDRPLSLPDPAARHAAAAFRNSA